MMIEYVKFWLAQVGVEIGVGILSVGVLFLFAWIAVKREEWRGARNQTSRRVRQGVGYEQRNSDE